MRQMCQEPIDISDDDEAVAEIVDQSVIQNMYTEVLVVTMRTVCM